ALDMLRGLARQGKYTNDLFHHAAEAEARYQRWLDDGHDDTPYLRALRVPYEPGPQLHFEEGDEHRPAMWATHPSNREREIEAKRRCVEQEPMVAPAARLFRELPGLRHRLTMRAYDVALGLHPRPEQLLPPEEIEALARAEREEVERAPHYHGLYENRMVDPGDLDAAMRALDAGPPDEAALRAAVLPWTGLELAGFFARL